MSYSNKAKETTFSRMKVISTISDESANSYLGKTTISSRGMGRECRIFDLHTRTDARSLADSNCCEECSRFMLHFRTERGSVEDSTCFSEWDECRGLNLANSSRAKEITFSKTKVIFLTILEESANN